RRGENFLGGYVRIAGHAIPGHRSSAHPFMAVRKPDGEVGSRPGETQRMETVPVEPLRALAQGRIVRLPRADRIVAIGAAGREDRIRQLRHRNVVALVWKHLPGPCELRIGNDRPVYY